MATSPEPKAAATAEPIAAAAGLALRVEDDLREVRRTQQRVLPRGEYAAIVGRFLAGEPIEGWELAEAARARYGLEQWSLLRLPDVVETGV